MTFPNYTTGDILYVTGEAENLYGKEADKIMPRQNLITRVHVTGYTYVRSGLNLLATESHPSPYNPPIKYLSSELHKLGKSPQDTRRDISLVKSKRETRDISTFTFEFPDGKPVDIQPGQHAILDFSAENSHHYQHMADDAPQSLNDDFVRSWTISSIPEIDGAGEYLLSTRFSCTIKNKYGGAISPMLHRWGRRKQKGHLEIKFIGVEGAFTCFEEKHQLKQEKLLFLAGGVGITPFMTMLEVIRARKVKADIVLLLSARGEEGNLAKRFQEAGIKTIIFDTGGEGSDVDVTRRRIKYGDITAVPDLKERGVYMCGPDGFMNALKGYLEKAGVNAGNVNVESFAF
jgi:ferredoxin-NADP reductase